MTPDQLTDDQKALIRGMADRQRNGGIMQSNIRALHFDGLWLAECLRLADEIDRVGVDIKRIPRQIY